MDWNKYGVFSLACWDITEGIERKETYELSIMLFAFYLHFNTVNQHFTSISMKGENGILLMASLGKEIIKSWSSWPFKLSQ